VDKTQEARTENEHHKLKDREMQYQQAANNIAKLRENLYVDKK